MAEINELFEEGITRSRELTDAADDAMNAIDEMAKEAEQLAQRVQDEGTEACQHMRDLASRLDRAEGELETARGKAEGALEGLTGKAQDLKTEAGELLERVKKSLDAVESRKDQLDGSLDTETTSAQEDFQELAQKTQEAEAQAEQHLQQAAQAIAAFRTAIDTARAEFAQKQQDWSTAVESVQTAAQEKAEEWVTGLNDLLARQSTALVEAANAMVDHHNNAMEGLKQRFVTQAPEDLSTALDPLEAALKQMGVDAAERGQHLSSEVQELQQWVSQARPDIAPIQDALDSAGRLG